MPEAASVGPVLKPGEIADAIASSILELNPGARVVDRGGYLRVVSPGPCLLTRDAVERRLGRGVSFPGDLELAMLSFKGKLILGPERVEWR